MKKKGGGGRFWCRGERGGFTTGSKPVGATVNSSHSLLAITIRCLQMGLVTRVCQYSVSADRTERQTCDFEVILSSKSHAFATIGGFI